MLRLVFLTANQAWTFTFGDQLLVLTDRFGEDHERFFTSRGDAVAAAADCGLKVSRAGVVTATNEGS